VNADSSIVNDGCAVGVFCLIEPNSGYVFSLEENSAQARCPSDYSRETVTNVIQAGVCVVEGAARQPADCGQVGMRRR
jgi:hypothetical protein